MNLLLDLITFTHDLRVIFLDSIQEVSQIGLDVVGHRNSYRGRAATHTEPLGTRARPSPLFHEMHIWDVAPDVVPCVVQNNYLQTTVCIAHGLCKDLEYLYERLPHLRPATVGHLRPRLSVFSPLSKNFKFMIKP